MTWWKTPGRTKAEKIEQALDVVAVKETKEDLAMLMSIDHTTKAIFDAKVLPAARLVHANNMLAKNCRWQPAAAQWYCQPAAAQWQPVAAQCPATPLTPAALSLTPWVAETPQADEPLPSAVTQTTHCQAVGNAATPEPAADVVDVDVKVLDDKVKDLDGKVTALDGGITKLVLMVTQLQQRVHRLEDTVAQLLPPPPPPAGPEPPPPPPPAKAPDSVPDWQVVTEASESAQGTAGDVDPSGPPPLAGAPAKLPPKEVDNVVTDAQKTSSTTCHRHQ